MYHSLAVCQKNISHVMFSKAYKLKSNNTLKNSEKKHLAQRVKDAFASTTEEKIKELVPVKSNSSCMKLVLHSGDSVGVFVVDGVPTLIEVGDQLVPTVCALWKVPDLVPMLTIHTLVLPKILGGAPLYLPGVTLPAGGVGFPHFKKGAIVSACTDENAAAALVGRAAMSSGDMLLRAVGTCLDSIQGFGDLLCKEPKFTRIERPGLGPPAARGADPADLLAEDITQLSIQPLKEEWPSLGPRPDPPPNEPALIPEPAAAPASAHSADHEPASHTDNDDTLAEDSCQAEEDGIPTDMDGLLRWCLLSFLKAEAKNIELPLKTNLLYKNHLMPYCPAERPLDVKKSTYKKMGKFLDAMQQEGLVEVREVEKGVSALVAVNTAHPALRAHRVLHAPRDTRAEPRTEEGGPRYVPPQVREMYCVTAACCGLLSGHRRGTPLSSAEVRVALTEYVKSRSLNAAEKKGTVVVDSTLSKLLGKQEQELVKWDELMSSVLGKMTASTEMRFADGTLKFNKSKLDPITMQVATRSGNKKVTLVSNLEAFGFNLQALSQVCQHGVAASCGVTRSPAAKHDQLMLQGDQTHYVAKLLIENYGLPKKFVEGADKALKKKK